jgi:hypothetical protein
VRRSLAEQWPKAAVGLGLAGIVLSWLAQTVVGGDSGQLMAGTEALRRCLADFDLVSCEQTTPIGPWPILQYLPDLVADTAGLSAEGRDRVLTTLSSLGVAAAVGAAWIVLRRLSCAEWRWGFLLVVVTGPALAYGSATWGEMLAAGLLTLLVAAGLLPARPVLVGLAAFGAGLTKETGYPFVVALGLVALLLARRLTGESIRRHVVFLSGGVALAICAGSALNLLRFGTPRNAYYLDPALRTATVEWFFEIAAGLFVAPNGGILFFWPLASLLVALLLVPPVVRALRREAAWSDAWVSLALTAIVGGLVAGLAAWWAPFGWWAWGPRLSLPWVFPIVLLSLAAFGHALTPIVTRILAPVAGLVAVAALVLLAALPHIGFLWRADVVGDFFFFHATSACPGGGPPPTTAYYDCLREQMWVRHPIWLDALSGLRKPEAIGTAAVVSLAVVGCLAQFRREAVERSGRPG